MTTLYFVLILAAIVCFLVAAFVPTVRFGIGWLGLALWAAVPLIIYGQSLGH